jgi:hypothetical protein
MEISQKTACDNLELRYAEAAAMLNDRELNSYRKLVEQMFDEDSETLISNSSTAHAAILVETLISRAQSSLRFFCKNLDEAFYDKLTMIAILADAAQRKVRLQFLTQEAPQAKKLVEFLSRVAGAYKLDVVFRICAPASEDSKAPFNFIVMDDKAFRFEDGPSDHVASASANSPDVAKKLTARFSRMWEESIPWTTGNLHGA